MTDEEWRGLERAHEAAPADQVVLERLMQARRRAGLPIPARLLRAVCHEPFEIEVPGAFSLWYLPPVVSRGAIGWKPEMVDTIRVPAHSIWGLGVRTEDLARPALLGSVVNRRRVPAIWAIIGGMNVASLAALRGLRALTTVFLSGSVLSEGLAPLASLGDLTTLVLEDTDMTGVGLAMLARLPRLSVLRVASRTAGPTREGIAAIGMLTHLTDLALERWGPGAADGLPVLAGLPHLETLDLRSCPGIAGAHLRSIKTFPSLRVLAIRSCPGVSESNVAGLARPGLEVEFRP